jgi:hypothetical protein
VPAGQKDATRLAHYPTQGPESLSLRRGGDTGLDACCGCAGLSATGDIWGATYDGNLAEVERLLGRDRGQINARGPYQWTPLVMASSCNARVSVVRWLLDQGAATNECDDQGFTALSLACRENKPAVVSLLLRGGATPPSPVTTARPP